MKLKDKRITLPKVALKKLDKVAKAAGTDSKKYIQNLVLSHLIMIDNGK